MSASQLAEMTQPQRDRLAFIELRLRFIGEIGRHDLVTRFGIQAAAATRDIAQYKELAPRNLDYDTKGKIYVRGEWFRPVFDFASERVLTWLAHGFGDTEPARAKSLVPCEGTATWTKFDLDVLSVLTNAIHKKAAVEISYRALSSGLTAREIVPFALANDGRRWHIRAFDRRSNEFRDFVLGRIASARSLASDVREHEMADQDIQWNRIVELCLVPHPDNVQYPDTIETEYAMQNGELNVRVRAAMAGYMLRLWNVDCSPDHSLHAPAYQLWLKDHLALYGVKNATLAPGYVTTDAVATEMECD